MISIAQHSNINAHNASDLFVRDLLRVAFEGQEQRAIREAVLKLATGQRWDSYMRLP
jgi:hypothetical protein